MATMMIRSTKRWAVFGTTAVALLLALASTAYACTYFKGKMTVQGSSSTGTSEVFGDNGWAYPGGGDSVMGYCGPIDGGAHSSRNGTGTFTVTVSRVASGHACYDNGTNKLPQDTYNVNYLNGAAFTIDESTGVLLVGHCCTMDIIDRAEVTYSCRSVGARPPKRYRHGEL